MIYQLVTSISNSASYQITVVLVIKKYHGLIIEITENHKYR